MTGRRVRQAIIMATVLVAGGVPLEAGWQELVQAEARLDLTAARELAIEAVTSDPTSAEAVAAAGWWLENLSELPEPGRILELRDRRCDPELGFLLARIEGELRAAPPAGALVTAELAGPFGAFDTLDLERDVVPPDRELPPLLTVWRGPGAASRLRLRTLTGEVAPGDLAAAAAGVWLAAFTVVADQPVAGWLVVEASGGINLAVDGRELARLRRCGRSDPGVSWYRLRLEPGGHRIRLAMGAPDRPSVRVSLLDHEGRPLAVRSVADDDGRRAGSAIEPAHPPASGELGARAAASGDPGELLLAAALAGIRRDPRARWQLLERARAVAPDDPWVNLAAARHLLRGRPGSDPNRDLQEARDRLRRCRQLPAAGLEERLVAVRERRDDDAERILLELVAGHGQDPRVLGLAVREAVRNGWQQEAEEGMARLEAVAMGSRAVDDLGPAVLAAVERHEQRRQRLRELLARGTVGPELVERLAAGCLLDEAFSALELLRERGEEPELDVALARLHLDRGDREQALAALDHARRRWGDLPLLDQLQLVAAAGDEQALSAALAAALARDPANLELRAASWLRGAEPFFAPFRVSLEQVTGSEQPAAAEVDVALLLDQAVEQAFADGSSLYYYHGVTRARSPVGARQAATLQPLSDALWLRIRVVKPDGSVVVPDDLTVREGVLELDDIAPGDLVEEEYVARVDSGPSFWGGHLPQYVYRFADPERAFGLSEYVLLAPPEAELGVAGNFTDLEREEWQRDGLRVIRWRAERMAPVPTEPFAPPTQDLLPWVSYGFGTTWQEVGDAFRDRVLPLLEVTPELAVWSAPLLAAGDPREAVRALVAAVCDAVDVGRGSLVLSTTAGESFSAGAGNRLLIVAAVLAADGWEVDLAMARPRPFAGAQLAVPALDAFSEPLLRVRRSDLEMWIDLEQEWRDAGRIRPLLQGSDALLAPLTRPSEPVTVLEQLPSFANPDLEQTASVTATVTPAGDARVRLELAVRGPEAERMRQRVEGVPEERARAVFRQLAAGLLPGASDVQGRLLDREEDAVIALDLTLPGACERDREGMTCRSLALARPLVPLLASLPERRFPLVLELPLLRRLELVVVPPPGWTLERLPRRLVTRWGKVEEVLEPTADRVRSVLTLEVPAQIVAPHEYPEFARFCHAVDELTSRPPALRLAVR